jgi:soluble lytic murein transglycosylase-like protein
LKRALAAALLAAGGGLLLLGRRAFGAVGGRAGVSRSGFSVAFDPIFVRRCPGIPVEFVRALVKSESDFRPALVNPKSNATGLLQITQVVVTGWNERTGARLSLPHLVDPDLNVTIGCDLVKRIADSYSRFHPRSLSRDFTSRRWVELLALGWNAGYSEASGVGHVVGQLEARGLSPAQITVDAVHAEALRLPSAVRFLREDGRVLFAKRVAARYFDELGVGLV